MALKEWKKTGDYEWKKGKNYIDVYYDDELDEPAWMVRWFHYDVDGAIIVDETDYLGFTKKQSIEYAKNWIRSH